MRIFLGGRFESKIGMPFKETETPLDETKGLIVFFPVLTGFLLKELPKLASQEVVESMRCWNHSGFSVNKNVLIKAGDTVGLERLVQYISRSPFSLERIIKLTDGGSNHRKIANFALFIGNYNLSYFLE